MSVVINNSRVTVFYFSIPLLSPFMAHISVFLLTAGVSVVIKDKVLTSSQRAFFSKQRGRSRQTQSHFLDNFHVVFERF